MDDFDDSDLSALFAQVDQLEATRKVPNAQKKVCVGSCKTQILYFWCLKRIQLDLKFG